MTRARGTPYRPWVYKDSPFHGRVLRLRARFFASYRDLVGTSELEFDVPVGSTVADAVSRLRASGTPFDGLPAAPAVAVNREHAPAERTLQDGDEVAFLPPVAGG